RIDIPHMWDIEIRHHMIDSGADLVICHHPHVIQGIEVYNGKVIAHSLGNFVFDLSYLETFPTMIQKRLEKLVKQDKNLESFISKITINSQMEI
ncbi:MAG: CapA family protein, partial [FCB group bacterium]|nr:CapA family protein [FCB group bacterium]